MSLAKLFTSLALLYTLTLSAGAQAPPETISRQSVDGIQLAADFYPAATDGAPVLIALHMLNSQRSAYDLLIPDLQAAGFALLNIDMRGHGDSEGSRDWDKAVADLPAWVAWLEAEGQLPESGLALLGASIGANVALLSCAQLEVCQGAIALSPGLDYRGLQPEAALADGLTALLVAAQGDAYSADSVRSFLAKPKARSARGYTLGGRMARASSIAIMPASAA